MTWVAANDDSLLGLTGLLWERSEATIEAVVVDRPEGNRSGLIQTAIDESGRRGATDVNILIPAWGSVVLSRVHTDAQTPSRV
jgi:hypothetical protein